jgi:stage V sporulation protein AF
MVTDSQKVRVSRDLEENEQYMKEHIGIGVSFDVGFRRLQILKKNVDLYYLTGLNDITIVVEIIKKLVEINDFESNQKKLKEIIHNRLVHQQVTEVNTMDEVVDQLLSGLIVVFIDGVDEAYIIDARAYPGRGPKEPDTEKVVRGSRDGYTENIIINTGLTRRRIRDERLRVEIMKVGERSKTDICIMYLLDVANPDLVEIIKKELENIEVDGLAMADKTIEEFLLHQGYNPFPMVRYTERPDVAASHLFEGHVIIAVDTSPSMIITPTTYFHHVQHAEEYRQSPAVGTFVRWVRFLGILASIMLLPLWYIFVADPSLLPPGLEFIGPNEEGNIPIFLQIMLADIGIEFLRMAAIHTPTPLSTAMGLIAAVLIGQIAIDVGLFMPEVILYVSISAIGAFATPSYELSVANKIARIILLLITALFGVNGFVIGCTIYVLFLVGMKSLNTPYLWPFIPFDGRAIIQILFRVAVPLSNRRPSISTPQNNYRQPS